MLVRLGEAFPYSPPPAAAEAGKPTGDVPTHGSREGVRIPGGVPERGADAEPSVEASRDLWDRDLSIPVVGVAAKDLVPTFNDPRGAGRHEALDIVAPRGTPVIAVEEGTIAKLFTSAAGGLTVYEFDPSRRFAFYYAHLDGYAEGLEEGQKVRRGQVLGYVGTTGNAPPNTPHLHFAIFELGPERQWWKGTAIDPYPLLTGCAGSDRTEHAPN